LRVICTIPITLMKLNERKILECKTVREMDIIFQDLINKSFNNEKFIQLVKENVDAFYNTNNIIETLIDYNENITWDFKRAKIEAKLEKFFGKVENENNIFLRKFAESNTSLGNSGIETILDNLKNKLNSIRDVYSTGTARGEVKDRDCYGILFTFPSLTMLTESLRKYLDDISIYVEYSMLPISSDNHNYKLASPVLNTSFKNNFKFQFKEQIFEDKFPKYMNIFLYNKSTLVGSYLLDIKKLSIMKPYKLKLESNNVMLKSILELAIFKWSKEELNHEESTLYNYFFSEPNYLYDLNLDNHINGYEKNKQADNIKKALVAENDPILIKLSKIDNFSFMLNEFKKNSLSISHKILSHSQTSGGEDHVANTLNTFFRNVFDNQDMQGLFADWTKHTDSSFEEVLYAACLVDPSTITIYEKLRLIYDIARMRNFVIYNEDNLTITKLKELIYSLYKRFMVYFTKSDVDRMVNYLLRKESLSNFKNAFIYDTKAKDIIMDILSENDNINIKDIKK
jgi:hypothetical protein